MLVLPRNAHQSAFAAMVLAGAQPHYLTPAWDPVMGVSHGVAAQQVAAALEAERAQGRRVGAVLVVSPTYFGVCSDVAAIAQVGKGGGHGWASTLTPSLPSTPLLPPAPRCLATLWCCSSAPLLPSVSTHCAPQQLGVALTADEAVPLSSSLPPPATSFQVCQLAGVPLIVDEAHGAASADWA